MQKNLIPWSMPAGIDLRYEFMPAVLKKAGYQTHHIGKWHQGFFTEAYTPLKRGYDSTFGFLVGGEVRVAALRCSALRCPPLGTDRRRLVFARRRTITRRMRRGR